VEKREEERERLKQHSTGLHLSHASGNRCRSPSFASTLLPNGYAHNYSARAAIMQMYRALTNYSLARRR